MSAQMTGMALVLLLSVSLNADLTFTTLFSFSGLNDSKSRDYGTSPSSLALGTDGNFYGTTRVGGDVPNGGGKVFVVSPTGVLRVVAALPDNSGSASPLTHEMGGNLYGTTVFGGPTRDGAIFMVSTNSEFSTLGTFNGRNGSFPSGRLLPGLYGTTGNGGSVITSGSIINTHYGAIFRGTKLLHAFGGPPNEGRFPSDGLVSARDGYLYGVTQKGGKNDSGTVFQISTNGTLETLYSFSRGANPIGGLVQAADDFFYGTTSAGGAGNGTIFRIDSDGKLLTLVSFSGTDGAFPAKRLMQARDGSFYGTTSNGGYGYDGRPDSGLGTVFRFTGTSLTTLIAFKGDDGSSPDSELIQSTAGDFYGTTSAGGIQNGGTIFKLTSAVLVKAVADFLVQPTSGTAPLIVRFTDTSTGTITDRLWDFGDGSAQTAQQNPSHTYTNGGSFSVILKVAGTEGTAKKSRVVMVNPPPQPPILQAARVNARTISLTWSAELSKTYLVQHKSDVSTPEWKNLGGLITATNSAMHVLDSSVLSSARQFYRVLLMR